MKNFLIGLILLVIFIGIFLVKIDTDFFGPPKNGKFLGPRSAAEVDDLKIQEAYINSSENTLILVTLDRWTRISLSRILQTNKELRGDVSPHKGNFVHWTDFQIGRPDPAELKLTEKVAVMTDKYASCDYSPPDGRPRKGPGELIILPEGVHTALFRSSPERGENYWEDFKSYLLVMPSQQIDGRWGIQFFYHPDYVQSVTIQPQWFELIIFGPSFLSLCIALPLAFSNLQTRQVWFLFTTAFILHGVGCSLYRALVGSGEAWGGVSMNHNDPLILFVAGCFVLFFLAGIKFFHWSRTQ